MDDTRRILKPSHDVAAPVDPDGHGAYSARDIDRIKGEAEGFYRCDLIDRVSMTFVTCARMFIPRQVADPRRVIAAPSELEEKIPAGSMKDAKTELVPQIEKIQEILRFAQTVKSKQNE